ncbi:uncharacterized protein BJ171DRAFT_79171 [Polychytrium aggregatum]|uniref:uncharacterized protein n=1 Tax=Polychytrium aggregatum TaxID=110093 RepID=UPI0022FE5231|nr:uncharacterized protein BJ171DRAFT_79171 [Polychytrium aggregatum]KAI9190598.1 hypothetical protein BJ171DRAFT_79171 [Polychytrium aggregatum]
MSHLVYDMATSLFITLCFLTPLVHTPSLLGSRFPHPAMNQHMIALPTPSCRPHSPLPRFHQPSHHWCDPEAIPRSVVPFTFPPPLFGGHACA